MASFAETLQQALSDYSPMSGDNEIQIRVKPLAAASGATGSNSSMTTNPQLASSQTSAAGEAPSSGGGVQPGSSGLNSLATPTGEYIPQGLTNKPLSLDVSAPLGSQTDSMYEAGVAQLAQATQAKYLDYLKALGYADQTTGKLIPGTLETEAIRQRYELNRQLLEAQRDVNEGAMRGGTVFSGRRAQLMGLKTDPIYAALANVDTDLQRAIGEQLQGIGTLNSQFTVDRNLLIAEAAERARQRAIQSAAAGGGGGGDTPPPAPPEGPPPPAVPITPTTVGPQPGIVDLSWLDPAIRTAMMARGMGQYT